MSFLSLSDFLRVQVNQIRPFARLPALREKLLSVDVLETRLQRTSGVIMPEDFVDDGPTPGGVCGKLEL